MTHDERPAPRRRLLLAGASAAALAAGAGLAWRRRATSAGASDDAGANPAEALWQLSFERPEGGTLALAGLRGKPLLINFWATWCAPCVREMPQIDQFYREFNEKGWQIVGLAVDGPTPVREFLATKLKVGFPIGLAGLQGTELSRQLGNTQGGLPFTVLVDAGGSIAQRKLGETSYEELRRWAAA